MPDHIMVGDVHVEGLLTMDDVQIPAEKIDAAAIMTGANIPGAKIAGRHFFIVRQGLATAGPPGSDDSYVAFMAPRSGRIVAVNGLCTAAETGGGDTTIVLHKNALIGGSIGSLSIDIATPTFQLIAMSVSDIAIVANDTFIIEFQDGGGTAQGICAIIEVELNGV